MGWIEMDIIYRTLLDWLGIGLEVELELELELVFGFGYMIYDITISGNYQGLRITDPPSH